MNERTNNNRLAKMSRVVEDDRTYRQLLDITLREKKLLDNILSKDKARGAPPAPRVGVLQTRFSPCPLSAREREAISTLRKEKNYSTLSAPDTASSPDSGDSKCRIKKPTATKLSNSGSRKGARISLKGETYDLDVALSDEAITAIENANKRHKAELGERWTSTIPKEFITKDERHTTGNLIREVAMEKVSFFLTFDRTPDMPDYYDKIFEYVKEFGDGGDDDDDDDDVDEDVESFGGDISGVGGLEIKKFGESNTGCMEEEDDFEAGFDLDDDDHPILNMKARTFSKQGRSNNFIIDDEDYGVNDNNDDF